MSTNARVLTGLQPVPAATIDRSASGIITNKLASFTVSFANNKAELKWTTENEVNLNHMMVEKSMDGKYFKDAAMIFTYGNTNSRSDYSFADNMSTIKPGTVYYRLRSVDTDGAIEYSETRVIEISK